MKKIINVKGTHCISCKVLLEREIGKIKNVTDVEVDYRSGKTIINYDNKLNKDSLENVLKKYNYGLGEKKSDDINDWLLRLTAGGVVISGWFVIKLTGWEKYLPNSQSNNLLVTAVLMGVAASLSTCLALVGSIVLSLGADGDKNKNLTRQALFHGGRLVGFGLLGGLLGAIGEKLSISPSIMAIIALMVGLFTTYKGLEILGVFSKTTFINIPIINNIGMNINNKKKWPVLIGILTFFVPCGFTQTAQIMAIASNSFGNGLLIMTAFGLGTLPVLLFIGVSSGFTKTSKLSFGKSLIGTTVVLLSIGSIMSSARLISFGSKAMRIKTDLTNTENVQVIKMDVGYRFEPNEFVIKKGIPVRWEINGNNFSGCTNEVIIPRLGVSSGKLKKGLNVVEFTAEETGVLPFSCWMGMVRGRFIVEE